MFLTAFSTRVSVLSSKTYNGDDTIKDLRSELSWVGQINYIAQKAWNALHFVMRVLKKKQKKKPGIQAVKPTRKWYVLFLNTGLRVGIHTEKERLMRETELKRKLLNLPIMRRIVTGKPWLSVG